MNIILNRTKLKVGEYFAGQEITAADEFIVAKDYARSVRNRVSTMTMQEKEDALEVAKQKRLYEVKLEDNEVLKRAFEYPVGSGNAFDLRPDKQSRITNLLVLKDSLAMPFQFVGNGDSVVTFQAPADIETFVNAALAKFQQIYQGAFLTTKANIASITLSAHGGDLLAALDAVAAVQYQ